MKQLNPAIDIERFWATLRQASHAVIMLDYDGTLAPFVTDPTSATPYPGAKERLRTLVADQRTELIMVSGRSIDDLAALLDIDPLPELWGSHGLEHLRPDGVAELYGAKALDEHELDRIRTYADRHRIGDRTEFKKSGAAFHWRGLDSDTARTLRTELHLYWDTVAPAWGLEVHEFDGGLELRRVGVSKALSVGRVLARSTPGSAIAFLGDDLTDEDGFKALKGQGLSVLVRPAFRETLADLWIVPPDELLNFLDRWIENRWAV